MVGTALALAGLASAAGSAIKGVSQAKAAKAAAKYQTDAAQQAQDYYRQGMGQLGQLYGPYINSGASAMGTLGRLTTPGPGARFASSGPPNATPQVAPPGLPPAPRPSGGAPPIGMAQPRGGPMPPSGGPPPGQPPPGMFGSMASMGSQFAPQLVQMADGQVRPLPPQMAQSYIAQGMARPVQGPYPQADGGDFMVTQPTMFLAGEAGPERASFSGGQPQGWGGFAGMAPLDLSQRPSPQQGLAQGLSTRAGALQGGLRGGLAASGANALRGPFGRTY